MSSYFQGEVEGDGERNLRVRTRSEKVDPRPSSDCTVIDPDINLANFLDISRKIKSHKQWKGCSGRIRRYRESQPRAFIFLM